MEKTTAILLTFVLFFTMSLPVSAQTHGGISISPALVDITFEKGEKEKKQLFTIKNNNTHPVSLELFPIDFKQKSEQGDISFLGDDSQSYSYSLSSFLSFETDTLLLRPNEEKDVLVTLLNREDLSPGGHYAAVVARLVQESETTAIAPAVSSLILLRKTGGERYNLSLKELDWLKKMIIFQYDPRIDLLFQNEGNVHLIPYGRVDITDMFGRHLFKGVINNASSRVLPSSRRYITTELRSLTFSWPISINTIVLSGEDSLKKTTFSYRSMMLYINPVFFLGAIIGSVLLRSFIRHLRKRKA